MTSAGAPDASPARPVVLIPARFSAGATALRYAADVVARAMAAAVYAAGGEPLVMHPHAPGGVADETEVHARLSVADAVLLPGGGDLSPRWSAQHDHPTLYDVDEEQDAFDLAVARVSLAAGLPLLAVCRGTQVVNVALGGRLVQDMSDIGRDDHRHRVHDVRIEPDSALAAAVGKEPLPVSCYHHQCLGPLGEGLQTVAVADDGIPEAVELGGESAAGWFLGVQWHPEDTAADDPRQAALFGALVGAGRLHAQARASGQAG